MNDSFIGDELFDYAVSMRRKLHACPELSGKEFVILADNLSDKNIYVDKVYLNGQLLDRTYITFEEVLQGGELRFEMKHCPEP